MKIFMVEKIKEDDSECRKCREVRERLETNDEMRLIDRVIYADARDAESEGLQLAEHHGIDTAPFFIVDDNGEETVYKTYLELRKKVFKKEPAQEDIQIEEKRKPSPDPDEDLYYM